MTCMYTCAFQHTASLTWGVKRTRVEKQQDKSIIVYKTAWQQEASLSTDITYHVGCTTNRSRWCRRLVDRLITFMETQVRNPSQVPSALDALKEQDGCPGLGSAR